MIYYPDSLIDQWILDDVNQGDLTTRILGFGEKHGSITFSLRSPGRVSGIEAAKKVIQKLDLTVRDAACSGTDMEANGILLRAEGKAAALHQAWKLVQNIFEWTIGVATYTACMVKAAKQINPAVRIATTRKNIPGTKLLALQAVLDGGGIIHRGGTAETILLFANHRRFLDFSGTVDDWKRVIETLKTHAPEKKVIVEAGNMEEALAALAANPDVLQLDKFSPGDVRKVVINASGSCLISAAGGVTNDNAAEYAAAGAGLLVTSAPYYAKPADVKVLIA
jgi:molybdenum transport protein